MPTIGQHQDACQPFRGHIGHDGLQGAGEVGQAVAAGGPRWGGALCAGGRAPARVGAILGARLGSPLREPVDPDAVVGGQPSQQAAGAGRVAGGRPSTEQGRVRQRQPIRLRDRVDTFPVLGRERVVEGLVGGLSRGEENGLDLNQRLGGPAQRRQEPVHSTRITRRPVVPRQATRELEGLPYSLPKRLRDAADVRGDRHPEREAGVSRETRKRPGLSRNDFFRLPEHGTEAVPARGVATRRQSFLSFPNAQGFAGGHQSKPRVTESGHDHIELARASGDTGQHRLRQADLLTGGQLVVGQLHGGGLVDEYGHEAGNVPALLGRPYRAQEHADEQERREHAQARQQSAEATSRDASFQSVERDQSFGRDPDEYGGDPDRALRRKQQPVPGHLEHTDGRQRRQGDTQDPHDCPQRATALFHRSQTVQRKPGSGRQGADQTDRGQGQPPGQHGQGTPRGRGGDGPTEAAGSTHETGYDELCR